MLFSSSTLLAVVAFGITAQATSTAGQLRRDELPQLPHDPNTTKYCTWWWENDGSMSCEEIPDAWGITFATFQRWNPTLSVGCSAFTTGRSYCVEAANEPIVTSTSSGPTTTPTSTKPTAPGPTQTGQAANCNRWDFVNLGDTCNTFVAKYPGLTLAVLTSWNGAVGSTCSGIWAETYLCTGVEGWTGSSSTTTSATTTAAGNGVATPTPIREGTVSNCSKFYFVKEGDECGRIATANGITLAQFVAWNPTVGSTCGGLWTNVYVCVALIGQTSTTRVTTAPATTTTGNGIATPAPTQPGMVGNCDAFYKVVSGDECGAIAASKGITLAQFYAWNTGLKGSCQLLWLDTYFCVSVVGINPSFTTKVATTTTKPGNGVATPTPIQAGMVANCNKFYLTTSSDANCEGVAAKNKITTANFISWNPAVGSGCANLWLSTYYCVGRI